MAAEQGHAEAMYHVATFPGFPGEPFNSRLSEDEAWHWLLRAAESGSIQAQYDAGASLATGLWGERGVPQNLAAAVAWYRRAAEAGHAEAQFNLASMLLEGEGCERDLPLAREWLRRSVAGGYEYAEVLLAHLDPLKKRPLLLCSRLAGQLRARSMRPRHPAPRGGYHGLNSASPPLGSHRKPTRQLPQCRRRQ